MRSNHRKAIYKELDIERAREDSIHGGAEHDATHKPDEWLDILAVEMVQARVTSHQSYSEYRKRLIVLGGVLVATLEALDIKNDMGIYTWNGLKRVSNP